MKFKLVKGLSIWKPKLLCDQYSKFCWLFVLTQLWNAARLTRCFALGARALPMHMSPRAN